MKPRPNERNARALCLPKKAAFPNGEYDFASYFWAASVYTSYRIARLFCSSVKGFSLLNNRVRNLLRLSAIVAPILRVRPVQSGETLC